MAAYHICSTCQAWVRFDGPHKCPPLWIVAEEAYPSDLRSIYAVDAEEAAEKWAEIFDSDGEYYLAKGNSLVVLVGKPDGEIMRVSVEGETVPTYRARELGPAPNPAASGAKGSEPPCDEGNPATDDQIPFQIKDGEG